MMNGFLIQLLQGMLITIQLASYALGIGMILGLLFALIESIPNKLLRYTLSSLVFVIRSLPELLVLFFIYFGLADLLNQIFHSYIDISPFVAGVISLSLIFGAYASQVFRCAYLAIDPGQIEAGKAFGFTAWQLFWRVQLPQTWRHAIPGLGNLWLVLLKDTAIVMLIGLSDLMSNAKLAASSTRQPFTFYLIAAGMYLMITSISQKIIDLLSTRANRYLQTYEHSHIPS